MYCSQMNSHYKINVCNNRGNDSKISQLASDFKNEDQFFTTKTVQVSNQHEFQYQTYLEDDNNYKNKMQQTSKSCVYSPSNIVSSIYLLYCPRHEITFLNGSPRCKHFRWFQQRKCRWITNNQFYFSKKLFQIWIGDIISLSLSGISFCGPSRLVLLMICQLQSLTFKFFLPPI